MWEEGDMRENVLVEGEEGGSVDKGGEGRMCRRKKDLKRRGRRL